MFKVAVLIPTRDRREYFLQLLKALAAQELPENCELEVICLNTGALSYDLNFLEIPLKIDYIEENKDGYVWARNELIRLAAERHDILIFIDDDEYPSSKWLLNLVTQLIERQTVAIVGPIFPDFHNYTGWKIKCTFFSHNNLGHKTKTSRFLSSGNLGLNLTLLRKKIQGEIFDQRFNMLGGEDTFLSTKISAFFGHDQISFSSDAIVYEHTEQNRLSILFMARKYLRTGAIQAELHRDDKLLGKIVKLAGTFLGTPPKVLFRLFRQQIFDIRVIALTLFLEFLRIWSYGMQSFRLKNPE